MNLPHNHYHLRSRNPPKRMSVTRDDLQPLHFRSSLECIGSGESLARCPRCIDHPWQLIADCEIIRNSLIIAWQIYQENKETTTKKTTTTTIPPLKKVNSTNGYSYCLLTIGEISYYSVSSNQISQIDGLKRRQPLKINNVD